MQVAEWVIEHAPTDPDLRKALDDILEKLEAVTQAQAGLSEDDRQWFALTLREELSQLGNLTRFEAALSGSGAIAQGKVARAVGQGGVLVEGDVHGDVVTGQKTTLFNQRGQTVDRQVNIAGNWTGQDAPGVDDEKE